MATAGDRITGPDGDSPSDFAEPGRETAEQAASPPTKDVAEHRSQSILYEPSWIDRLTDWVSRLPTLPGSSIRFLVLPWRSSCRPSRGPVELMTR